MDSWDYNRFAFLAVPMVRASGIAKASLLTICIFNVALICTFSYHKGSARLRVDRSADWVTNDTRVSTENPIQRDINNVSKRIDKLNQNNDLILQHLVNLSRLNVEYLRTLNEANTITNRMSQVSQNSHLNVSVKLTDFPLLVNMLKEISKGMKAPATKQEASDIKASSLLTLFTTWPSDRNHFALYNLTVSNWASFKPIVSPVVFTDDPGIQREVTKFGWKCLKIPKAAKNGKPVLKYMFMEVVKRYDSVFYAYANADILFTEGLVLTLTSLQYSDAFFASKHIFISGVRTNLMVNFTENNLSTRDMLQKYSAKKGAYFQTSAEDYFITDKGYPWSEIPEVIIGAIAYDNYLVADARNRTFTAVDATRTVKALHVSDNSDNYHSHSGDGADYNKVLLGNLFGDRLSYYKGFTDCMGLFTDLENDRIVVKARKQFAHYC